MRQSPEQSVYDDLAETWPDDQPMPSGPEFEAYLGQVARLKDAQVRLAAEGTIIADAKGNPMPHPALAIEKGAAEQLRRWGQQFTPKRRRR